MSAQNFFLTFDSKADSLQALSRLPTPHVALAFDRAQDEASASSRNRRSRRARPRFTASAAGAGRVRQVEQGGPGAKRSRFCYGATGPMAIPLGFCSPVLLPSMIAMGAMSPLLPDGYTFTRSSASHPKTASFAV